MYKLYFETPLYEKREIAKTKTKEEAKKGMYDFLKKWNYKVPYERITFLSDKEERYDIGSHTEFFYIEEI